MPGVEQRLQHRRRAADAVEVEHDVLAARLQVRQVRHLLRRGGRSRRASRSLPLRGRWPSGVAPRSSNRRGPARTCRRSPSDFRVMMSRGRMLFADAAASAPRRRGTSRAPSPRRRRGSWRRTAGTCPSPRWRWTWCWRCTCRRRSRRRGSSRTRSCAASSRRCVPAWNLPTASKMETMSTSSPSGPMPGRMLPP